ncbi:hypothetical protein V6N13_084864 [Hibiscus sabdariffa]
MLLAAVAALLIVTPVVGYHPRPGLKTNSSDSEFVDLRYHMRHVLIANITIHMGSNGGTVQWVWNHAS